MTTKTVAGQSKTAWAPVFVSILWRQSKKRACQEGSRQLRNSDKELSGPDGVTGGCTGSQAAGAQLSECWQVPSPLHPPASPQRGWGCKQLWVPTDTTPQPHKGASDLFPPSSGVRIQGKGQIGHAGGQNHQDWAGQGHLGTLRPQREGRREQGVISQTRLRGDCRQAQSP